LQVLSLEALISERELAVAGPRDVLASAFRLKPKKAKRLAAINVSIAVQMRDLATFSHSFRRSKLIILAPSAVRRIQTEEICFILFGT